MTDEKLNFRALVEKILDADLLREMIGFAAQPDISKSRRSARLVAPYRACRRACPNHRIF